LIPVPSVAYRLLAVLAVAGGLFAGGVWIGWDKRGDIEEGLQAKAQAKQERKDRKVQDQWQARVWNLAYELRMLEIAGEDAKDAVVTGLDNGTVRVQPRLQCPKLPKAPGTPTGNDDPGPTGLTEQDAKVAIGIAADGDTYARRLATCQAYVKGMVQ
jgi:hypothetical protein